MEKEIEDKAVEILRDTTSSDYSGWQTEEFIISELEDEDPENYVMNITTLQYMGYDEEIRGIIVDLNEYAEQFNDVEL
jgi:hypothetical protein